MVGEEGKLLNSGGSSISSPTINHIHNPQQSLNVRDIKDSIVIQNMEIPTEFFSMLTETLNKVDSIGISQELLVQGMSTLSTPSVESPNEIYSRFMRNALVEIKGFIEDGRLSNAQLLITNIIQTEGFERLNKEYIIEIYYYQGLVYLSKNLIEKCQEEIEKIFRIEENNYYGFNLMYKISVDTNDQMMYEKAMSGLNTLSIDVTELKLKELYYEITKSNFSMVISEITELDELKEQYIDNGEALYYLGLSYLQTEELTLAKKYLLKSNEITPSSYKIYLLTIIEIIPIINKRGLLFFITDAQKETLNKSLQTLIDIKGYFIEKPSYLQEMYWGYIFNIKLFTNPSEIIDDIEIMEEELKFSDMIQLMLAEAYSIVGSHDKSEGIYKALYHKRKGSELLNKITTRLLMKKDYVGLLNLLKDTDYSEYDELGDIAGTHIIAFSKLNIFPASIEFIGKMEELFPNAPLLYQCAALVFSENNEIDLSSEYMEKAINLIEEDNEVLRMFISNSCESIGLIDLGIKSLLPLKRSTKAQETILRLSLQFDDNDEMLQLAEQTAEKLIRDGKANLNIYNAQAEIAFRKDLPDNALKHLIESFKLSPTIDTAYNIVAVKININQPSDIQGYIDYLLQSSNARATMIVASALDYLGDRGTALEVAYRALFLLGDEFDESIYLQYSMLFMVPRNLDSEEVKIEYDKIRADTVVELKDNSGATRYICIESNPNLVNAEGEVYLNIEHYTNMSSKSILVQNIGLNRNIEIDGIVYLVNQIINKYVYAFRFVSSIYIEKCPESPYLQAKEIKGDDPITPLIPLLEQGRVRSDFLMKQYNFENSIGLPISALCQMDYFKYPSAMMHLLETKEQVYYAGDISNLENENVFVLSFSTVVLLAFLKCTDVIRNNKESFKITKGLLNKIKNLFDEAVNSNVRVFGSMSIDKSGRPVFSNLTEDDKSNTIEFWRNLYLILSDIDIIDEIESYSFEVGVTRLIGDFELEIISASNNINGVFITDDLFLHKLAKFMYDSISTANSVSILNRFLGAEEILDKIYTLSQFKYHFCVNEEIMIKIINDCLIDKTIIYGIGTNHDKLKQIIRNTLSHPQLFKDNLRTLIKVVYTLYDGKLNPKMEDVIIIIIREIVISSRNYRISSNLLMQIFEELAGIDLIKIEYVKEIFKKF